MIKVLNLYAGIGGNRKLWTDVEVTAVENNPEIAKIYQDFFPNDKVIVADAHQFLLEHYKEFDFIWSSPPCPTHSIVRHTIHGNNNPKYPDMKLYEEIIFLKYHFKGMWVVENVISYYEPIIKPQRIKNHYFWSNFIITGKKKDKRYSKKIPELVKIKGFNLDKYKLENKRQVLQNCVLPQLGLHIFNMAFKDKQRTLV